MEELAKLDKNDRYQKDRMQIKRKTIHRIQ